MIANFWKMVLLLYVSGSTAQSSELLNQSIQEFRAGDYTSAQHSLVKLISASPQIAPAHNLLGLVFMQQRQYAGAAREFTTALRLEPQSASAHVNLGNALVELHQDDRARVEYLKALSLHPEDAIASSGVGLIYARQHNDREAVHFLKDAHRLSPADFHTTSALAAAYLDLKDFSEAGPLIDELLLAGPAAIGARDSLSSLALENGDPELGAKCVNGDLGLEHKFYDASVQKALDLVAVSKYQQALPILLALRTNPQRTADYYDLLGTIHYKLDDPKKAVDELQEAIRLEPSNPDHYFKLGMMFLKHRTGEGAVLVFDAALKAKPDVPKLWMGLGLSYYIQGNVRTAKEKLYHAISLDPTYGPAYVVLCDVLSQTGGEQELLQIAGKELIAEPTNYLFPYYYGKALARQNDPKAIPQLRKSIALNSGFASSYFELGKILANNGDNVGAIDAFSQCLKIDPNMAEAHYSLFRIYHSIGKQELAASQIAAFKQLREGKSEDERIQQLLFTVDK